LAFHNCLVPHFPPLQFGADTSSLAFSVAPQARTKTDAPLTSNNFIVSLHFGAA